MHKDINATEAVDLNALGVSAVIAIALLGPLDCAQGVRKRVSEADDARFVRGKMATRF